MVFNYYLMLIKLLQIGIPYHTILEMEEEEINYIIGTYMAIIEKQQENL